MKIERKDNEILVRIPSNVDITGLQKKIFDYIKFPGKSPLKAKLLKKTI